ncbi:MAG: helix-turn-helix domain-containing protein [Pseudohongiellaceae bacterium]
MELVSFSLFNWRSIALLMPLFCTFLLLANGLRTGSERASLLWLMAFTAAAGVTATPMIIGFAGAYDRWPDLTFLPTDFSLFLGPLLLVHARTLMLKKAYDRALLLWFVPGLIHLIYQFITFTQFSDYEAKWQYSMLWHDPYVAKVLIFTSASLALGAIIKSQQLRKSYLSWLENHHANELRYEAIWFSHLYSIAPPLLLVWLVSGSAFNLFDLGYGVLFWTDLVCLIGLFLLVAEATSHLNRLYPKQDSHQSALDVSDSAVKSKNWREEGQALLDRVDSEQWYLDPMFTLQDLSRMVGSNQSYVSKALNSGLNRSFSTAINELRVKHAKQLIADTQLSLLDVAEASGFGSKSSFNRAFSQHAGQSPSAFKSSIKEGSKLKFR